MGRRRKIEEGVKKKEKCGRGEKGNKNRRKKQDDRDRNE
jgi:hypothetical protein